MNPSIPFCSNITAHFKTMCSSTCFPLLYFNSELPYITNESACRSTWFHSIIGLVVEFVVAIDEARVRFTDDAQEFLFCLFV